MIKYLTNQHPLDRLPISEADYKSLFGHLFSTPDPDNFHYGIFRQTPNPTPLTIDMTHVKRIRTSIKDPQNKVDIILTTQSNWITMSDDKKKEVYTIIGEE